MSFEKDLLVPFFSVLACNSSINMVIWSMAIFFTYILAHQLNVIKLEDVDSILDCDRVDIFYNLYSLVSPERINLII